MKEVTDSARSKTFCLYRTSKDKVYMGFPKKMMGRRMLVGSTIAATSNPSYVNIGRKYVKPTYFQIDLQDSLVVLSVPGTNATSSDPEMQTAEKNLRSGYQQGQFGTHFRCHPFGQFGSAERR